ncbi:DinB family protein [Paenibacillus elgii]|uniref:DinB family protein n=1 Tax=Paenibacillus elgii TaxID=189691 RepID=UPI0013D5D8C7|nr:DinB family protein [Paenibacillus elgii]
MEISVDQAKLLLRVPEVTAALRFYEQALGWERLELFAAAGCALLRQPGGDAVLLAAEGAAAEALRRLQALGCRELSPGGRFYVTAPPGEALELLQQRAEEAGGRWLDETEPGCWRTVTITTPEGYRAAYWQELFPSDEETLALFAAGPDRLEAALAGLGEAGLDLARAPGTWSIREQVLHVVDLELAALHKLKFALAGPERGRVYHGNGFSQDAWAAGMRYASRPIRAEVALFRLLREHVLSVCEHTPGELARSVIASGKEETAGRLMKMMAGHANVHIRRIGEIRKQHAVD